MAGLVPAIHVVVYIRRSRRSREGGAEATRLSIPAVDLGPTWMTGTSPVMTLRAADGASPVSFKGVGRRPGAELAMRGGGTSRSTNSSCQSCVVVLCLFSCRLPGGDRRADGQSFGPRRFGRRIAAREGPTAKRSRREMAPQRLEKIESAPGNGMGSDAWYPQHLVHGRATDRARLLGTSRTNTKLQKKAPKVLNSLDAGLKSAPAGPPILGGAHGVSEKRPHDGEGKFSCLQGLEKSRNEERISPRRRSPAAPPISPSAARASSSPATASPGRRLAARRVRSSPSRSRSRRR